MRIAPLLSRPRMLPLMLAAGLIGGGAAEARTQAPAPAPSVSPAAAVAAADSGADSDPFEKVNRKIYAFNQALDRVAVRPLAVFWRHAAPKPLRQAIGNFLTNLSEPVVLVNDVLQGRPATAAGTATRFVVNTLVGVAGVLDVAGPTGLPHHDNGFGLTLGRWGVKPGPYLYVPILGPTTLRDGVGAIADIGANPLTYTNDVIPTGASTGLGIASGLDTRANADSDLKALTALSTDPYAALRSFYLQNRQSEITGGKIDLNALPDFDDPGTVGAPAAAPSGAGPVVTPAVPGSVAPSARPLTTPGPVLPSARQGPAAAPPHPATPQPVLQETPADPAPPPADPKAV